jgi:lipid-A-disaccharide synthase-like uncharacterized protein
MKKRGFQNNNNITIQFTNNQFITLSVIIIIIILIIVGFFIYYSSLIIQNKKNRTTLRKYANEKIIIVEEEKKNPHYEYLNGYGYFSKPNNSYTNLSNDVLLNPYVPPLKDNRYIQSMGNCVGVPININTSSIDTNYRQIGILISLNDKEKKILPLMGKPLFSNRYKWNYFTQEEKNNVKLPIIYKKKSCTSDYGCDEIYNNDVVFVKGYNNSFRVEMYDNETIRYLPFI